MSSLPIHLCGKNKTCQVKLPSLMKQKVIL